MRSLIFEYLGITARWLFFFIRSKVTGKKAKSFKEVRHGDMHEPADVLSYGCLNIFVGLIIVVIIAYVMVYFSYR